MGRKKRGYKAPEGLVRMPGSPYWYVHIGNICKSTKTADLPRATIILREVQKRLLEKQLESRAKEITGDSIPFSKLIKRYLAEVSSLKKSRRADNTNSAHPLNFFADRPIDTIRPQDIYAYQDWRKKQFVHPKKRKTETEGSEEAPPKRPISGATVNRERALISHALKWAIRWGYIERNPVGETEGFSENQRERYITDEEFKKVKEETGKIKRAQHLCDILDTLYHTAQRLGRILNLRWSQIDLPSRIISFEQTSKNKKTPDEIWINDRLFSILSRLKGERSLQKVVGPYVFQKRDGRPYGSIKKAWNTACGNAGVVDAHLHDLRHKALSDMAKKGYPLQEIAKAGGHSQISTTMRYTHLRAEDTRLAFEGLVGE